MESKEAKLSGSYYTPPEVAQTLVRWVATSTSDRMLDPSCGDGEFLSWHTPSTGVEQSVHAAAVAANRTDSLIHVGDFFDWAQRTKERFECAAGNPPFIRYQHFKGDVRRRAIDLCKRNGVQFSALSASWAPFLVVTAGLLKQGGRLAFVVPAEIGHAPYASPLLHFLTRSFSDVRLVAIKEKLFPHLSQDVWLLFAGGFGGSSDRISLTIAERFKQTSAPPRAHRQITLRDLERRSMRLRPFLLSPDVLHLYDALADSNESFRLGDRASVGIGYVTGANDFFHLRPSVARAAKIPEEFLRPAVRSGRSLPLRAVTDATVSSWMNRDEACLLLHIRASDPLPRSLTNYLHSEEGRTAQLAYKCRVREPWYVVPDVSPPDGFLTYMCGSTTALVANQANCVCTNSVHAVRMKNGYSFKAVRAAWSHPLTTLSAEIQGHPLGGGMLKLEPREAQQLVLPTPYTRLAVSDEAAIMDATRQMQEWRHYA